MVVAVAPLVVKPLMVRVVEGSTVATCPPLEPKV
jgi:hypothetical protein